VSAGPGRDGELQRRSFGDWAVCSARLRTTARDGREMMSSSFASFAAAGGTSVSQQPYLWYHDSSRSAQLQISTLPAALVRMPQRAAIAHSERALVPKAHAPAPMRMGFESLTLSPSKKMCALVVHGAIAICSVHLLHEPPAAFTHCRPSGSRTCQSQTSCWDP
jgi:hypothetical protein